MLDVIIGVIIGARPVRRERGLIDGVGRRRRLIRGGEVGAAEGEETKRRGGYRRRPAPGCISNVGEGVGM